MPLKFWNDPEKVITEIYLKILLSKAFQKLLLMVILSI
jgi:hypothetical protein